MLDSNIVIIWTLIFEWCVVRRESKNGHQKDMCLKEIELCVQNMLTIIGSIIDMIGGLYDHLMSKRMFTLIMNKIFI